MLGLQRAGIEMQVAAHQIFGLAHVNRNAELLRQPAGKAGMVGMEVGDDDAVERPVEFPEQHVPRRLGGGVAEAGIDQRPAGAVIDQIDVQHD